MHTKIYRRETRRVASCGSWGGYTKVPIQILWPYLPKLHRIPQGQHWWGFIITRILSMNRTTYDLVLLIAYMLAKICHCPTMPNSFHCLRTWKPKVVALLVHDAKKIVCGFVAPLQYSHHGSIVNLGRTTKNQTILYYMYSNYSLDPKLGKLFANPVLLSLVAAYPSRKYHRPPKVFLAKSSIWIPFFGVVAFWF